MYSRLDLGVMFYGSHAMLCNQDDIYLLPRCFAASAYITSPFFIINLLILINNLNINYNYSYSVFLFLTVRKLLTVTSYDTLKV